jgi:hypothetical protein
MTQPSSPAIRTGDVDWARLRGGRDAAANTDAAEPGAPRAEFASAADQELHSLRVDLSDVQFKALWKRLQKFRPELKNFAPSPYYAAAALQESLGQLRGDGRVEIHRLDGVVVAGSAWRIRADELGKPAIDLLGALIRGEPVKLEPPPEVVAVRVKRRRIRLRMELVIAFGALASLLAMHPWTWFSL